MCLGKTSSAEKSLKEDFVLSLASDHADNGRSLYLLLDGFIKFFEGFLIGAAGELLLAGKRLAVFKGCERSGTFELIVE